MNKQDILIIMGMKEIQEAYRESNIDYEIENFIEELLDEMEMFPDDFQSEYDTQIKLSIGSFSEDLIIEYFKELLNEF